MLAGFVSHEWTSAGQALQYADEALRADKEVVLEAVGKDGLMLRFASADLRADRDVVAKAGASNINALRFASKDLTADGKFMLEAIAKDKEAIHYAADELRIDKDFIAKAVAMHGFMLAFASDALRADAEVVMQAVASDRRAMEFAHEDLRGNKDFMMQAVATEARLLQFATEDLRADRELVLQAVELDDQALLFAHEDFWADKEVVMRAVAKNGSWLKHVRDDLKEDKDVVMAALAHDESARLYVPFVLRNDKEFMMEAERRWWLEEVARYPSELWKAPEWIKKDRQVVYRAVLKWGFMLNDMRRISLENKEGPEDADSEAETGQVRESVAQATHALQFAHEDLRRDEQVVMQAVCDWGCALQFAHEDRRNDKHIVMRAVAQQGAALKYAGERLWADRQVVLEAVARCGRALEYAHEDLRADREVVMQAISQNGQALEYAHEALCEDKEIVLRALKGGCSIRYVTSGLHRDNDVSRAVVAMTSGLSSCKRISCQGRIIQKPGASCIASFPGVEAHRWETAAISGRDVSVACVFLASREDGLGWHGETCMCKELYGSVPIEAYLAILEKPQTAKEEREYETRKALLQADAEAMGQLFLEEALYDSASEWAAAKRAARKEAVKLAVNNLHRAPWGCLWFEVWTRNIEKAVRRNQDLLVYFLPDKVEEGMLCWNDLACPTKVQEARRDTGLGNSQRAEVAWLDMKGYLWKALDVRTLDLGEPASCRHLEGVSEGHVGEHVGSQLGP